VTGSQLPAAQTLNAEPLNAEPKIYFINFSKGDCDEKGIERMVCSMVNDSQGVQCGYSG
jgi:hypothetical protein